MNTIIKANGAKSDVLRSKYKVNSFRSPLGGKNEGDAITVEFTGDVSIVESQYKNAAGENIVSAYALCKNGYRLKLDEGFVGSDYGAGKTMDCIVMSAEIDGRTAKWLAPAA